MRPRTAAAPRSPQRVARRSAAVGAPARASPRSGRARRRRTASAGSARARPRPCRSRRRGRGRPARRRPARRGSGASVGPGRARGCAHNGRTWARAGRTARALGASGRRRPGPRRRVYSRQVELTHDLRRIADAAVRHAQPGEELAGIVPTEPAGSRAYLCAYERDGETSWLVLDAEGHAVDERGEVRAAVSIAALCELAEDVAGGGDLDDLRSRLVALRVTENPGGIDEAEAAALDLQRTIGGTPRLATPAH